MSTSITPSTSRPWPSEASADDRTSQQPQQAQQQPQPQAPPQIRRQPAASKNAVPTLLRISRAQNPQAATTSALAPERSSAAPVSPAEALQLLSTSDDKDSPSDAANAESLAGLQTDGLRSMPKEAVDFEKQQVLTRQKIAALPQKERERYSGMQAAGIAAYESADTPTDRQNIAKIVAEKLDQPVAAALSQSAADPAQRLQQVFNPPFGVQYLGASGRQQAAQLAQLRERFAKAGTAQERKALYREASAIRRPLQLQIASRIEQSRQQSGQQWADAEKAVYDARDQARSLQIDSATGELDNTSSFERLKTFADKAFTSERNAQAFQHLMQTNPDAFKDLKAWYNDASAKSQQAHDKLQSNPFQRAPNLPPALPDLANVPIDDLPMGNFGANLLDRYKTANAIVGENEKMYHAASQGGAFKKEYLAEHTQPKPLWRRQAEDALARFFVDLVPGVNMLADYIVPAESLSPEVRAGIDIMAGALSMVLPEMKIPKLPELSGFAAREGEVQQGARLRAGAPRVPEAETGAGATGEAGALHPPAPAGGAVGAVTPLAAPRGGIAQVPDTWVGKPAGELTPDPALRGIYRDSRGDAYIQQGGQRYKVSYDKSNQTWAVNSPEGGPKPTYKVRLDSSGNWEINPETGLKGGAPPLRYTDAKGREAYSDYIDGWNYVEIGARRGLSPTTARRWVERYARENQLTAPHPARPGMAQYWSDETTGLSVYGALSDGRPLEAAADQYTEGNTLMAARSAMRYALKNDLPVQPVVDARVKAINLNVTKGPAPLADTPANLQPQVDPMSRQQYEDIQQRYDAGQQTPEQIAAATGVPEPWVKSVEQGDGYWSPSKQAYVEPLQQRSPPGSPPPAKRQRVVSAEPPSAGGTSPSTSAGPAPAVQGWGRNEMRMYVDDANQLGDTTFNQIYDWLNAHGPEPAGLQQEMLEQGFAGLTPGMVREYLTPGSTFAFSNEQRALVARWLGF